MQHSLPAYILGPALLLVVWVIGTWLDAMGTLLDLWLDNFWVVDWDYFHQGNADKVHQLDEYYHAYYCLDRNFAVGLLIFLVAVLLLHSHPPIQPFSYCFSVVAPLLLAFSLDGLFLRKDMRRLIREARIAESAAENDKEREKAESDKEESSPKQTSSDRPLKVRIVLFGAVAVCVGLFIWLESFLLHHPR